MRAGGAVQRIKLTLLFQILHLLILNCEIKVYVIDNSAHNRRRKIAQVSIKFYFSIRTTNDSSVEWDVGWETRKRWAFWVDEAFLLVRSRQKRARTKSESISSSASQPLSRKTCSLSIWWRNLMMLGNIYAATGVFSIIIKFIYHPFLPLRQCAAYFKRDDFPARYWKICAFISFVIVSSDSFCAAISIDRNA